MRITTKIKYKDKSGQTAANAEGISETVCSAPSTEIWKLTFDEIKYIEENKHEIVGIEVIKRSLCGF